eukprot:31148-Pelagococcus_subviridis.AAC.3
MRANVGVEFIGVRSGVERRRGSAFTTPTRSYGNQCEIERAEHVEIVRVVHRPDQLRERLERLQSPLHRRGRVRVHRVRELDVRLLRRVRRERVQGFADVRALLGQLVLRPSPIDDARARRRRGEGVGQGAAVAVAVAVAAADDVFAVLDLLRHLAKALRVRVLDRPVEELLHGHPRFFAAAFAVGRRRRRRGRRTEIPVLDLAHGLDPPRARLRGRDGEDDGEREDERAPERRHRAARHRIVGRADGSAVVAKRTPHA